MKINFQFILLILLFFIYIGQSKAQNVFNKIDSLIIFSDSLLNSETTQLRTFVKADSSEIPFEIFDFDNWDENIVETYNIFFDANKKPIVFIVIPYSKSGDWTLSHNYYLDKQGKTYFYRLYLGFFNSICTEILRKYIEIYFNDSYDIIKQAERFEDKDYHIIKDISDCNFPYDFNLEYFNNISIDALLNNYKIKL
jgi:hypothetical protein